MQYHQKAGFVSWHHHATTSLTRVLMNRTPASFFSFSRLERMGIFALLSLIGMLFVAWRGMQYFVHPDFSDAEEQRLLTLWKDYQARHMALPETSPAVTLSPFDPNTIDSIGMLRLGLAPRVAKGWLNWRRHGKKFYAAEDLKPLYNLSPEDYQRLEPYIVISLERPGAYPRFDQDRRYAPLPATINLNTADSALLVRLNGIGPVLAHRIVEKRALLGGFISHKQLLELYPFPDSTFHMLCDKLEIRPEDIRKIPVNTAGIETLQRHPYIGEKTARNILQYREGLRRFENIEQLRQVPLMNEEIYRRIAPYLVID